MLGISENSEFNDFMKDNEKKEFKNCPIIFLDVDGPMIPGRLYYKHDAHYSIEEGLFKYDPVAVDMINTLCDETGAKIVSNSAHNAGGAILEQMIFNGLHHGFIHPDYKTGFPNNPSNRAEAIGDWYNKNKLIMKNYCVIDDEPVQLKNLVQVDFRIGMTMDSFELARRFLTGKGE